jgi:hypothetical protein
MQRQSTCCDLCGGFQDLRQYPTGKGAVSWYACADCARLIDAELWEQLIERSIAAYGQIRPIPVGEEPILRQHVEQLVHAFRSFRLVGV